MKRTLTKAINAFKLHNNQALAPEYQTKPDSINKIIIDKYSNIEFPKHYKR